MSHSPKSNSPQYEELLERGRLTLRAIQFREQAALYRAEATSLQAALLQAEKGVVGPLEQWLELKSGTAFDVVDPMLSPSLANRAKRIAGHSVSLENRDQRLRVDGIPIAGSPAPSFKISPWARMEQAALARLGTHGDASKAMDASPSRGNDLFADLSSDRDVTTVRRDSPANENLETSTEESTEKSIGEVNRSSVAAMKDEEMGEPLALSQSLRNALEVVPRESPNGNKRPWWRATHVWISLVVHACILVLLSVILISAVKKPQVLSIVSASVEADNVLTETPMELISELETTLSDAAPSTSGLSMSDLAKDVALPSLQVDIGRAPAMESNPSSSVLGTAWEIAQGMSGSKMVAGAEFFGVKATGNTFVYVVDSSPSMRRDGAFEKAKQEMMRSLASMKPKQRYFIHFFGKEIDSMTTKSGTIEKFPVYAIPENISQTIDWMRQVQVQKDGWPPNEALARAIAMQPDGIFLLFDGDTKVDVAKFLRRENRTDDILSAGEPKVAIHVIHFFQDEFQKQMKQIAEENGGTYRFVPRPERPSIGKR